MMYNNAALDELQGRIQPAHFYVPFHAQLFETMEKIINKGYEANPITVRENLKHTPFAQETDLFDHLTRMLENAQHSQDVLALAELIHTHYLRRQLMQIGADMQRTAAQAVDMDATQATLEDSSSNLFTLAETGAASTTVQTLKTPMKNVISNAEEAKARGGKVIGVPSGFDDLDTKLGGFQKSDLIILAARPSMGKTALALNIATHVAKMAHQQRQGVPVGLFSLEMSADQLATRVLCSLTGINSTSLLNGHMSESEYGRLVAVSNELADYPLYIDDTPQLTISALRSRARRMKRQYDIGLLVVDYLQLMRAHVKGMDNRVQEISEISMGLKAIARELNVPVIALSQLSRAVEQRDNKRPQLSDLRESGSIEQDADIVMFLYREEYYIEKQLGLVDVNENDDTVPELADDEEKKMQKLKERLSKVRGKTEVLISKNRKGATGGIALHFQPEITTFHGYSVRH
jgi:replicative DNA helicase